jgi:glycosyltransferase involved in cell wall biosynthesis
MSRIEYTAIIRTDRSGELIQKVVKCLRAQALPPTEILFVDSSGSSTCRDELAAMGARVIAYPDEPFNFSKAINTGTAAARCPHVLLISSHVLFESPTIVSDGLARAASTESAIVYWYFAPDGILTEIPITRSLFDGKNGLSNSSAFFPLSLLRERLFKEEVFSAEDQEWAAWYFRKHNGKILRISHPDVKYLNPYANINKIVNEEIAVAYYARRRNLLPDKIIARLLRASLAAIRRRPDRARMHWEIAKGLFFAWFKRPQRLSKYY